jgi:peptide/nickel transport system substrate-binding protein
MQRKPTRREFLFSSGLLGSSLLLSNSVYAIAQLHAPSAPVRTRKLWSKKLLQAIAAAVDREALVEKVFAGQFTPAYHQVPPGYPFATKPFFDIYGRRNLNLAVQLLKELGYTNTRPFIFNLWWSYKNLQETTAVLNVLKEQIEETGLVKVHTQSLAWGEYVNQLQEGKLPAFLLVWTPDFVDADNWLSPFAASAQSGQQGVYFSDPRADRLLQEAASAGLPSRRAELYKEVGQLYADEVVTLPLYWRSEFVAYQEGVRGFAVGPPFEFNYNVLSFGPEAHPVSGRKDTILIGTTYEVQSLDAQDAHTRADWEILKNTGTAMMSYKPGTAELIPGAAEDFPKVSDNGTTYTFTLRKGIKFADGTPLTAQDYAYLWRRASDLGGQVATLMLIYVKQVEAAGERTVVFRLHHPYSFFPDVAATPVFIPVNPNQFKVDKLNRFPKGLDGVGAYRLLSYEKRGDRILEANPQYYGDDKPIIPNVILKFFPDAQSMAAAVEERKIDIAYRTLGLPEVNQLRKSGKLRIERVQTPTLQYITFNHAFTRG